ncbi:leucyl/phenylalanyl-tRNA--protein transferase [Sphingomonas sp. Leaf412]|uniref:leucyl/phenylalanyl-tRNA--protein transferase n=1 Tax=Sphingomonas sp. Leaf412 TaxID=1736370 RepID=UPI0006F455F1|nr:leucyl/phenylalanyl-tRNA--protein transferase [Sphingomonas sp. Leaf412]
MADARDADDIYWVEPRRRAILPLDRFHLSRSLRRTLRADRFRVTADRAFGAVIALCAESAADRPDTWINRSIEQAFRRLHAMGRAHSIECWDDDRLVGGLYGLSIGRAFFGESMVSRATDASKVAIASLVARLRVGGFTLLDCQFMTDHLASLGAEEISRADYMALLGAAVSASTGDGPAEGRSGVAAGGDFRALDALGVPDAAGAVPGKVVAQLLVHTS